MRSSSGFCISINADYQPNHEGLHFTNHVRWKIRLETRLQHGLMRAGFKIERDGWHPAIVIRVGERLQSEKRIGKQVP